VSQSSEVLNCDDVAATGIASARHRDHPSMGSRDPATRAWARALVDLLRKVVVEIRAILELRAENSALRRRGGLDTTPSAIMSKRHRLKRRVKEGGAA
jgi:hypothetical protein